MKTATIQCAQCQREVEKPVSEINRNNKLRRKNFCSLSCSTAHRNSLITNEQRSNWNIYDISQHCGNQRDHLSPFRGYLNSGKASNKKHGMSLTPEYLKTVWEEQRGICPYTGIKMILPKSSAVISKIHSLKKASLDRIDSSKGYVEGNVEFVCYGINLAKNSFTKKQMKEFLLEIGGAVGNRTPSLNHI